MHKRKFVLLLLPTLVAFLVGGYAGELFGLKEFFWAGAFAWAAVIFIIDYNFTRLEKLSFLGNFGRILLVLSSALITATVGDHILFQDTIKNEIEKHNKIEIAKSSSSNPRILELKEAIGRDRQESDRLSVQLGQYTDEMTRECRSGIGPKCSNLQRLVKQEQSKIDRLNNKIDGNESELSEINKEANKDAKRKNKRHDLILELTVLYGLIFSNTIVLVVFILLTLMVICIETLPLLLKTGKTREDILRKRRQLMWRTLHRNL